MAGLGSGHSLFLTDRRLRLTACVLKCMAGLVDMLQSSGDGSRIVVRWPFYMGFHGPVLTEQRRAFESELDQATSNLELKLLIS